MADLFSVSKLRAVWANEKPKQHETEENEFAILLATPNTAKGNFNVVEILRYATTSAIKTQLSIAHRLMSNDCHIYDVDSHLTFYSVSRKQPWNS